MKLTWAPLAMVFCVGVAAPACGPVQTSSMREDDLHVLTDEDRAMAEGQPRPLPAEAPSAGEDGHPPMAMAQDLELGREPAEPANGPVQLEEPRPGGRQK